MQAARIVSVVILDSAGVERQSLQFCVLVTGERNGDWIFV